MPAPDPRLVIDLERYPVLALDAPRGRAFLAEQRRALAERGVCILPGFVRPQALAQMASDAERLRDRAFLEDVSVGTPYLELPDASFPEGHPRRTNIHSRTWVIAYDLIPESAALRALYEWDGLRDFLGAILERSPLHRYADPLGALNLTCMEEGHVQGWHYDSTDFVVSLAIQASRGGGQFECASRIRSEEDENYEEVARVLRGEGGERVEVLPMVPGTLMVFAGRHSLHRVSPVRGPVPRVVGLLAYDTRPGTNSSALLKAVRYGRTEPLERAEDA
jgi:hypothetical protein